MQVAAIHLAFFAKKFEHLAETFELIAEGFVALVLYPLLLQESYFLHFSGILQLWLENLLILTPTEYSIVVHKISVLIQSPLPQACWLI